MFYSPNQAYSSIEEDPSLSFKAIHEGYAEVINELIKDKKLDINTVDDAGNSIMMRLLKAREYEIVLNNLSNVKWNINHQNLDGNTFCHILTTHNDYHSLEIMKKLKRKKKYNRNIMNNKDETILDIAINNKSLLLISSILKDKSFNNINIISFKKMYDYFINNSSYGSYTKVDNFKLIIDNLDSKELLPRMEIMLDLIKANRNSIIYELKNNDNNILRNIVNSVMND